MIADLTQLAEDARDNQRERQAVRLRSFRRLVADLDLLESTGVMALTRRHTDDQFLNQTIETIRSEIRYPLAAPVVSSLSQQYFHIKSELNLLFVPLIEGTFCSICRICTTNCVTHCCLSRMTPHWSHFRTRFIARSCHCTSRCAGTK